MPITMNGMGISLPKEYAATVLGKAFEESVVGKLTPSEPLPLGDYVIPQYDGGFEVGVVAEGTRKPVGTPAISNKVISPIKLAGIIVVSQEVVKRDPGAMMSIVEQDMINAISRGIDFGILFGKSAATGTDITGALAVNQTTNRVELTNADLAPQLLAGYDLAAAAANSAPTGFAFDSRFRAKVAIAAQQAKPLMPAIPNLAVATDTVAGLPAAYGNVVSGRIGAQPDTKVKGFVGDWSKVRWGFGDAINLTRSDQATIVDGTNTYNLFQDNLIALRVECTVGWTIMDVRAFAAYEDKVA